MNFGLAMFYSDYTTITSNTEDQEDEIIFMTRQEAQVYLDGDNGSSNNPLKKPRRSIAAYLKGLFR